MPTNSTTIAAPNYLGLAFYNFDLLPARIDPVARNAYVTYGGAEHRIEAYVYMRRLILDNTVHWQSSGGGNVPAMAVACGLTETNETLYVARARELVRAEGGDAAAPAPTNSTNGRWLVGKMHPSHGVLYVGVSGRELPYSTYELLVWNEAQ